MNLNLRDPVVRELMGSEHADYLERKLASERASEMVQLAGDMDHGLQSTISLAGGKQEVFVNYKDFMLTVDVYQIPGEPTQVHLICPRCRHQLRVTSDRKKIEYDPNDYNFKSRGGRLSIEPFQCTWELPEAGDQHTPGIRSGGLTLCKLTIGISDNRARDA